MQIQLNQNEIETAIRNYVHEQINVREGMDINIVLKATRGDDGQTAIIDIVAKPEPKPAVEVKTGTIAVQRRPRLGTSVASASDTSEANKVKVESNVKSDEANTKEASSTALESLQAGNVVDNSTSSDAAATTGDASNASQAGENQAADTEIAPVTERKSLFSGLSRPVNS